MCTGRALATIGTDPSSGPLSFLSLRDIASFETASSDCLEDARDAILWATAVRVPPSISSHANLDRLSRWLFHRGRTALTKKVVFLNEGLDDGFLTTAAAGCPRAASVHVECCPLVTDTSISAIARSGSPGRPRIESLTIAYCSGVTAESVRVMSMWHPAITSLRVNFCKNISGVSLAAAATRLKSLRSLDISLCYDTTDRSVKSIAACCTLLTTLKVHGCCKLTDDSIREVSIRCPSLTSLDVSFCYLLTSASADALRDGCPLLTRFVAVGCPRIPHAIRAVSRTTRV
jgi:hypothetical protein